MMICEEKWYSVVRLRFFILDAVLSVNTSHFVKTMVNARIVVTPHLQKGLYISICSKQTIQHTLSKNRNKTNKKS
jgi:hypothetical protein